MVTGQGGGAAAEEEADKQEKTEHGFHMADGIKHRFRDPQHFELIKNIIEDVHHHQADVRCFYQSRSRAQAEVGC